MVDQVAVVGSGKDKGFRQANIKLRFNRNPVIGAAWNGQIFRECLHEWRPCSLRACGPCDLQGILAKSRGSIDDTQANPFLATEPPETPPSPSPRRQVCVAARPEGRAVPPV